MAKEDGQVIELTDKLLIIKYKSGKTESIKIGKHYGRMEGGVYPHYLVTNLQKGSKFKTSDTLAYNQNFFEPDWLNPNRLITKFSKSITVALSMNNEVFEDSSAISKELSEDMATEIIKEKIYVFEFKKNIINITPEGTEVKPNTILFSTLDEDADFSNLSESTINMLQSLASLSPKAKYNGTIDRYEIKYNGELSDMSPTIRKLATKLDKQLYEETKGTENEATNNRVTSEYRSEGKNLSVDTLELKVFIKVRLGQQIGDKGSFANQMKSIISDVYNYNVTTESGEKVDAFFSYRGCLERGVLSPVLIGTTVRLAKHVSTQVADIYFK